MKDISIRKIAQKTQYLEDLPVSIRNNSSYDLTYLVDTGVSEQSGYIKIGDLLELKPDIKNVTFRRSSGKEDQLLTLSYNQLVANAEEAYAGSVKIYKVFMLNLEGLWKNKNANSSKSVQNSTQKGGGSQTNVTNIKYKSGVTLSDGRFDYTVTSPISFKFIDRKTKDSGSMNSSHRDWNAAAKNLNALKPLQTTADTSAPATTGTTSPTAPEAPPATATPAPAPAATPADTSRAIDGLKKILSLAASNSLKIDTKGFDFKSESKVWRGVIKGYGGPDKAAEVCLSDAGFTQDDLKLLSEVAVLNDNEVSNKITMQPCLKRINDFFYKIKNKYSKRFLGITVATEEQITRAVAKGLAGDTKGAKAASLAQLNLLSKVAARRERAKKSLDSAIEKEASVEDDMTSKVEKRRAAARAKLGL